MELIRLDKYLSNQIAELSRKEATLYIKKGRVRVDGETVKVPETKINADTSTVTLDGERIGYKKHLYIMLNKPSGVVCATRDGLSATVLELLPKELRRRGLFPAGRLDKDTEGFVLITTDGDLAHRMLSPKSHVDKEYYVKLELPLCSGAEDILGQGIKLTDGTRCMPSQIKRIKECECNIILHQGMFHQVKRMFEALDNKVVYLKRVRIGNVWLDEKLKSGEVRELSDEEIFRLTEVKS